MQQMYRGKPMPKCDFNKVALALNEKYLKAKIKSYSGKINTNVHNNKIPKRGSQFFCLSVILIYSVFITGKIYYPQVFVEERKVFVNVLLKKKNAWVYYHRIEISSYFDREGSNEKNSNVECSVEQNFNEKN